MNRASGWAFSHEIPSDVTVKVGEVSFSLHKFPLVSKSGYIEKLVSASSGDDVSFIELYDVPGGAEAFELATKFCYGINFEISVENIADLRCVAEFLEMTEDYSVGNLVGRADSYLNEVALKTISGAVSILHVSERLLPIAEKAKVVSRCIDAIAFIASKETQLCSSMRSDISSDGMASHQRPVVQWWAEDFTVLRIDIFQRVVIAMLARGFKQFALGPIIMLYAQKSLRGLEIFGKGRKKIEIEAQEEHEKRVVLETLVSLLPREKNAMSVSFLSMLLRAAIYLETTVACRLDLEKRMALQLGQAVLDDLLIPSYSFAGDTLFDVDTVQRIMMNYLQSEDEKHSAYNADDEYFSPSQSDIYGIGKLMENYLAEVATDRNLVVSKFITLAELIPQQSRSTDDGMYRAIDIYLKAHPILSDTEKKKVCSVMDCQKLSRDACAHAAQNDRLPVQTVVQILYYEQQRLRDSMDGTVGWDSPNNFRDKANLSPNELNPMSNEFSNLRRENEELKLEIVKLRMKLKEIEISSLRSASSSPVIYGSPSADKPPLPRKSFINSVSKKLGRLSPFSRGGATSNPLKGRVKPDKNRRHSIS
ncbi:BTB/POZ domain-containing protein At5g67385 [Vigna radiata var. radiata]|uniref:BTB/POZ domain-containing protein At5g67385 n=1 Tax=Vigna radiata var. radiata TaxID=3916 RepID=A0A1S3UWU0_VIGRR|nr:BTB/POZ domain-containing protein At5g67385 [Vigna radiata var. radiata]XP_014510432.1 BTB/POZ domain-containing protein At5g67385 [Vigna radiata var. radiata]XP_014510433.1 BTB/POZ domain-containing protein At5g67385 [Vigna radiata var. radiata]